MKISTNYDGGDLPISMKNSSMKKKVILIHIENNIISKKDHLSFVN